MKSLTILSKGMILIAVPLLFQLLFIGLVSRIRKEGSEAEMMAIHTKVVIAVTESCRTHLLSSHGAVQGATITGDRAFLDELPEREKRALGKVEELRREVADNADQSRAADLIGARTSRFLDFMTEGARMIETGAMDIPAASGRRRAAELALRAIDRDLDRFVKQEQKLDVVRHVKLDRSWRVLDGLLSWGCVVSVLGTGLVGTLFGRNISGRIVSLTRNAQRLAEGRELTPPIAGGDEIARLDRVFHEMAGTLAEAARRDRLHAEVIERRAEELDEVNAQLREKATENEMFVYSVSHDLRSPLVNLQGFSKELDADLRQGPRPARGPRCAGPRRRSADEGQGHDRAPTWPSRSASSSPAVTRLSGIIDALLRLSRAGRVEYRRVRRSRSHRSSARVVAGAPGDDRGAVGRRSRSAPLPGGLGRPDGHRTDLREPDRQRRQLPRPQSSGEDRGLRRRAGGAGRRGTSRPARSSIAVRGQRPGDFADSYKSKIFTAFQRLHGDVAKGEGVGLALVRRAVERLGGKRLVRVRIVGQGHDLLRGLAPGRSRE